MFPHLTSLLASQEGQFWFSWLFPSASLFSASAADCGLLQWSNSLPCSLFHLGGAAGPENVPMVAVAHPHCLGRVSHKPPGWGQARVLTVLVLETNLLGLGAGFLLKTPTWPCVVFLEQPSCQQSSTRWEQSCSGHLGIRVPSTVP